MRGGIFMKRQPHQCHPIGRYALRDRTIDQFQLLLVQSQFDDRLGHGLSLKLYTGSGSETVFSDAQSRRPIRRILRMRSVQAGQFTDYSRFYRLLEAQSLGVVLPNLRARRTKFPHRVYQITNYRMREGARSNAPKACKNPDSVFRMSVPG
jgi:hypothetical protein